MEINWLRRNTRKKRVFSILLVMVLTMTLLPVNPQPVKAAEIQAYRNPPIEELARKLEIAARTHNIPSAILKALAFVETGWRQWDRNGNVVTNYAGPRPNIGIMQIASYDPADTETVNKLKYNIDFNIAYGADILNAKWEMVPKIGDGDRNKLENWYFAIWAYNGWSKANNPNTAASRGRLAYQDKVLKYAGLEYYPGVTPVEITPIPKSLLPAGTIPGKSVAWDTPEPFHLGDLKMGQGKGSRGQTIGDYLRIAGQDRIDSVNQIALTGWPYGCETVIITRSDEFPDALAGVALAEKYNAPILVTPPDELDSGVTKVLEKLKPLSVIMLGGEGALSSQVEQEIKEALYWVKDEDIQRIAGKDRYETAALIAREFPREGKIALSTGDNFPDALSLAAAAASQGAPLLLTGKDHLPEATAKLLQDLLPRGLYIAGGEGAISAEVVNQIVKISGLAANSIIRFQGSDRYETSVNIAKYFYPETETLYAATGQDFADPLAAGALAANKNCSLLLVPPAGIKVNSPIEEYIRQLSTSTNLRVIGGKGAITDKTVLNMRYLLGQI